VVDARVLEFLKPVGGSAVTCGSILLVIGIRGYEMLNALACCPGWVLAVALAITRGDGRARSGARARGSPAEVGWLLLALDDSTPRRSGLPGFGVKLFQHLYSSIGGK
jgi:hypothetical protein